MSHLAGHPPSTREGLAAVLFDMDGTLVDSEKLWDRSLADLAAELGGTLSPAVRSSMVGSNLTRSITLLLTDVHSDADPEWAGGWLLDRTRTYFAAGLTWRTGAEELLLCVRDAGLPTALVTSTHRSLTEIGLDTLGRDRFDVVVCGDEVAHAKPNPEPYRKAAAALGVDPRQSVAIEDSPTGVAAARSAGCPTIAVPHVVPIESAPGVLVVGSLAEIDLEVLSGLVAR
ncbi:MAG: HAD family hydrolase [Actinomycetes bacterium]